MNTLVTGDDSQLVVRLLRDGQPFPIVSTATVSAALVSQDHKRKLSDTIVALPTGAGAKWDMSLVALLFPSAVTDAITEFGPALVEIQVAGIITETWFIDVQIVKGQV